MGTQLVCGDIFAADVEALVNPVNCVGVMGKGLALQFKERFPENFRRYAEICKAGKLQPGTMFVWPTGSETGLRYVVNFPTKRHWRDPSTMDYVERGLDALIVTVQQLGIRSIATPALGCGNGGLVWPQVREAMLIRLAALTETDVRIYEPESSDWTVPERWGKEKQQ